MADLYGLTVMARCWPLLVAGMALQMPATVRAQGLGGSELIGFGAWRLAPSAALSQTFTSHVQAAEVGGSPDSITDATAGVVLRSGAGLVTGSVDYRFSALAYQRDHSRNTIRHALSAHLDAEWVARQGFLAMDATVTRQAISAFGFQPVGGESLINSNATNTTNLRLTPRWQGLLPGGLRTDINANYGALRSSGTSVGDNDQSGVDLRLAPQLVGQLGWSVNLQTQRASFRAGRTTDSVTLSAGLDYRLDSIDTLVSSSVGSQRSDLITGDQRSYAYWTLAANWLPSPRTALRGSVGRQDFGGSHSLSLEHRTALMSLRVSDSRALNSTGTQTGATLLGTAYQLFDAMLTSKEPDPAKRAELVSALLKERGISADTSVSGGFLASSATVVDSQNLSLGMQWPRSSATLAMTRSTSQRAGRLVTVTDDLATSDRIRLRGVALALSHRLTPSSAVTLTVNAQSSAGDGGAQRNRQRNVLLNVVEQLTSQVGASLGLRRALVETASASYDENALIAAVSAQF